MRILVTGAAGLLGTAVVATARSRGHDVRAMARVELDVTDLHAVRRALEEMQPQAVLHCAAYTAVDRAESEPTLAAAVNRGGTANVAAACSVVGAKLVYVSSDYVFDGRKATPYLPTDAPAPLSAYARTKLAGEVAAEEGAPGALIVRSGWLYGGGRGFVSTVLRRARANEKLQIVDDQRGGPTWASHAAPTILDLLEVGAQGIWHVANRGACTWYELGREVLARAGLVAELCAVSSAEYGAAARRPAYSVLDLSATEERLRRRLPSWREALGEFFAAER